MEVKGSLELQLMMLLSTQAALSLWKHLFIWEL